MNTPLPIMQSIILDKTDAGAGSLSPVGITNPYIEIPEGISQVTLSWVGNYQLTINYGPNGRTTSGSYPLRQFPGKPEMQTAVLEIVKKDSVGTFWVGISTPAQSDIGKPVGVRIVTWPPEK